MATFFLVRHAEHDAGTGILPGRMGGVHLSVAGQGQAAHLASYFVGSGVTGVQSSPRERAVETAHPIAAATGHMVELAEPADEVDFGRWSGKSFPELETDPDWVAWNADRASARTPAGDDIAQVRHRITGHLQTLNDQFPNGRIVIVSHAETIRTAVLHYLGLPFDAYGRIQIDPACVTTLALGQWGAKLCRLNERPAP